MQPVWPSLHLVPAPAFLAMVIIAARKMLSSVWGWGAEAPVMEGNRVALFVLQTGFVSQHPATCSGIPEGPLLLQVSTLLLSP